MKEKLKQFYHIFKNEVLKPAKKRMNLHMLRAAMRLGGFIGWYFTVLKIGEMKLNDVYASGLSTTMKTAFLSAEFITLAVITVFLVFYDVEKLVTHKYIRYLPGVFLAEGSIALALTDVYTVIPFSVIAGITSAIGSAAILTSLLKVKQRYRLAAIGGGLCIAGIIYILICGVIPMLIENTSAAVLTGGIIMAVITALTVHFEEFTGNKTRVVNRFDKEGRKEIVHKLPYEYLLFIIVCTAFFFAFNSSYTVADSIKPMTYHHFDLVAMFALVLTSAMITLFVRSYSICPLFAGGSAVAGAAAILLNVHVISGVETTLFAFFSYVGLACFRACALLFVCTFALNRPHPLFFAIIGYTSFNFSELAAQYMINIIEPTAEKSIVYTMIFFILLPVGYILISRGLARHGYSPDSLESRHRKKKIFIEITKDIVMTRREREVAEYMLVDGLDVSEIQYRMYISENAVQNCIKKVLVKVGEDNVSDLLKKFNEN